MPSHSKRELNTLRCSPVRLRARGRGRATGHPISDIGEKEQDGHPINATGCPEASHDQLSVVRCHREISSCLVSPFGLTGCGSSEASGLAVPSQLKNRGMSSCQTPLVVGACQRPRDRACGRGWRTPWPCRAWTRADRGIAAREGSGAERAPRLRRRPT